MKILIAINENNGMESKLSEHFGHCPYFAIYETGTKDLSFVENNIDHSNQSMTPIDQIMKFSPEAVFTLGIGRRAIDLFSKKGVVLKTGDYKILQEVIDNVLNLKNLSEGCNHEQ